MYTPRTEFAQAIKAIASGRGLSADIIMDAIKQAIVAAYKRDAKEQGEEIEEFEYSVKLDPTTGEAKIFAFMEGKEDEKKEVTPPGFGRIATQTAKQVIHQKIKEAEKGAIMSEFSGKVGELISGMILRFDGPNVRVDLGRTEGLMLFEERVPNERLNSNQRMSFLLKEISETPKGKQILLSRADSLFVQKLFKREVPEIASGSVEIKSVVREPGTRTKIAVFSNQPGVDPVGSCVGQKGVRVQAVTNELGGERVDIVPFSENEENYIKSALSPAEGLSVKLDKKNGVAQVEAPEDQLSLAIGKDGQNARLAAKLTGWKIKIIGDGKLEEQNGEDEIDKSKKELSSKKKLSVETKKKSRTTKKKTKRRKKKTESVEKKTKKQGLNENSSDEN